MPRDEFVSRDTLRRQKQRRTGRTVMICGWVALLILVTAVVRCSIRDAGAAELLKTFELDGKVYACWADKAGAVRYENAPELAVAFIERVLFGTSSVETEPWTACDDARCYGSDEEIDDACTPPLPPWVVAENKIPTLETQPLKACDAKCLKNRVLGKGVGRSGKELVTACEGPLEPPWIKGETQFQFTTNAEGVRGIARCQET